MSAAPSPPVRGDAGGPGFVVLAHKAPGQVERLIARLAPMRVFLHVDAGAPPAAADALAAAAERSPNARMLPRHRSGWASWGLVAAALEGVAAALGEGGFSHVMLLSGQDYPLVGAGEIQRFFAGHADSSFMARWPLPSRLWGRAGGMDRIRFRQWPWRGRRLILPVPRRLPRGIEPFGGPMYWALSAAAAAAVLAAARARPDVVRFYRSAWIPDEMFVPTMVMNGPERAGVLNESLTYVRWASREAAHPDVLRAADVAALLEAGRGPSDVGGFGRRKLFARKFDVGQDPLPLDLLDEAVHGGRG